MKKGYSFRNILIWFLIILWLIVIYKLSAEDGMISGGRSKNLAILVQHGLKPISYVMKGGMFDINIVELVIRKIGHMVEYFVLAFLILSAFNKIKINKWISYMFAFLIPMIYALLDEFHQSFIPWRDSQLSDAFIDVAGVILGILAYRLRRHMIKNRAENNRQVV